MSDIYSNAKSIHEERDNCLHALTHARAKLNDIVNWLIGEVENTELTEELAETDDDFIIVGRKECAESLLSQINKWEQEL